MKKIVPILFLAMAFATTGCKPVKVLDVKEIKPNETCWVIPLDGASQAAQVKFDSVGFLEQKKVASKRVMIDKVDRKIGRMWWDIEWIPAVRVITVDRSLVTREWTDGDKTGTSTKKQGIQVVTKDSIQLTVGLTITASIEEADASTYLYYHGERRLSEVVDENVRSFAVAELTRQYSEMDLTEAQKKGPSIYTKLFEDAAKAFKAKGVTIQYLGNAEGMHYDDPKIQDSINAKFMAEQSIQTARQEQSAQAIRNATKIQNAQAEADAAQKLYQAQEAAKFQNQLNIQLLEAQARYAMATNWNGHLPANILPANSPLLMSLGETASKPTEAVPVKK